MKTLTPIHKNVLNLVRIDGYLSRNQIADNLGIGLTKTIQIIRDLAEEKFIEETSGPSSGGRKPTLVRVKNDLCYAIGIDVGTQILRTVLINANGDIISEFKNEDFIDPSNKISIDDIVSSAHAVLKMAAISWEKVIAIGIGITGIVDEKTGTCLFASGAPHWNDTPLVETLKQKVKTNNIYLTDSVRGKALAELRYGMGQQVSNFVLINIGVGLGAGIVIDKKVLTGSRGIIGEFGHIYVGKSEEICCCGNYGCLESMASGWALVQKATKAIRQGVVTSIKEPQSGPIQFKDIIDCAKNGDKFALNLLAESIYYLSTGISTLINLLNPERVLITGGLIQNVCEIFWDSLISQTKAKSLPWFQKDLDIRLSQLGEYSAARGNATMAMDKVFTSKI